MIRRRPLAVGLAVLCASLAACRSMSDAERRRANDKVVEAVKANDLEAVKALLDQGAPADARVSSAGTDHGYTVLLYAVEQRFLPLTQLLLRSGADPGLPSGAQDIFPLMSAARAGQPDVVAFLLAYGANINQKRPGDGIDALAVACLEGHLAIVERLVARGATIEPQDLSYAVGAGHVEVVKRLLEAGADPSWSFNGRPMMQVARESPGRVRADLLALLKR